MADSSVRQQQQQQWGAGAGAQPSLHLGAQHSDRWAANSSPALPSPPINLPLGETPGGKAARCTERVICDFCDQLHD